MDQETARKRKEAAVRFLQLVVAGRIDEAYEKCVDMKGKHHNVFFPAGFEALKKAMTDNQTEFPTKGLAVKNVICEDDLVAVHSHLEVKHGEPGMVVVHIARFQGAKIIEFWDCGQAIPADSPNKDGAF